MIKVSFVLGAMCILAFGCGRIDDSEFTVLPPREWDEGTSSQVYAESKDTGKLILIANDFLLRGERPLTIKERGNLSKVTSPLG